MGNEINKKNDGFNNAYQMLPVAYQAKARKEIMKLCGWSEENPQNTATFHSKKRGQYKIKINEKGHIEKVFKKYNLNAWTGQYITQNL